MTPLDQIKWLLFGAVLFNLAIISARIVAGS